MDINDSKAINFREDLIGLLRKYKCNISGSNSDDGSMNLELDDKCYVIQDFYSNYNIQKFNEDAYENIDIIDDYIKSCFSDNKSEMCGLNNIKLHSGVYTNDSEKAESKLLEIYDNNKEKVQRFINSRDTKEIIFTDGARYVWIRPIDSSRGYRCSHAIIDRDITLEVLHNLILPYCYACSKDDIEVF